MKLLSVLPVAAEGRTRRVLEAVAPLAEAREAPAPDPREQFLDRKTQGACPAWNVWSDSATL